MDVRFRDPARMNLLGYFVRDLLRTSLAEPGKQRAVTRFKRPVLLDANGMRVTLHFTPEAVEIAPGQSDSRAAHIRGDLNALLDVALGAPYVPYLLRRRLRISRHVPTLLRLMGVLRVR